MGKGDNKGKAKKAAAKKSKSKPAPASEDVDAVGVGQNIELSVEGDILTLVVDLSEVEPAIRTGKKTHRVASSLGNVEVPGREGIRFGLNVFQYPDA
jgi:hypothetical protein